MKEIKSKFRYATQSQKDLFGTSSCVLGISVGQEVHEGDLLKVTLALINKSFLSCNILVDDTLQRYTIAMIKGGGAEDYRKMADINGELWLSRNQQYIDAMSIPHKVFRYQHWLVHPEYSRYQTQILNFLNSDHEFKDIFYTTRDYFVNKHCSRYNVDSTDKRRIEELSFGYLLEECTTYCLLTELSCRFKVHPGVRNAAREYTRKLIILPQYPDLLQHVGIYFKNVKPFSPQKFEDIVE